MKTGIQKGIILTAAFQIIDDFTQPPPLASNGQSWELISDGVMGGVSEGVMGREKIAGRAAMRMQGEVSLENNGGFLQMAIDLGEQGENVDASGWTGIEMDIIGNNEAYNIHLRTADVQRSWQSYRHEFIAPDVWTKIQLPFADFNRHRIEAPLDLRQLRRLGIVAIGRAFRADIAIGSLRFY